MEMSDNTQMDVSQVESNSSSEQQSSEAAQSESSQQDVASTKQETPFHEHPRFRELVEEKNTYKTKYSDLERQFQEMSAQFAEMQKASQQKQTNNNNQPSYDQILNRLKDIDPEFAQFQSALHQELQAVPQLKSELEQFREWKYNMEVEQLRTQAESTLESLYKENNVPDELKNLYRSNIENLVYKNDKATLNDLKDYFKQTHEGLSKFFEDRDRKKLSSYQTEKKKDQVPATQTGGQAPSAKKADAKPMSMEEKIRLVAEGLRQGKQQI